MSPSLRSFTGHGGSPHLIGYVCLDVETLWSERKPSHRLLHCEEWELTGPRTSKS